MITWTRRLLFTCSVLFLLATNLLTLTSTAFNATLSGLMSTAFGVQTVSEMLRSRVDSQKKTIARQKAASVQRKAKARKFGTRLISRTKRVAAAGIARIPAESFPFIGISVLVAGTVYELYEACEGLEDLDQLYLDIGMSEQVPDDVMHSVCDPKLPDFS